MRVGKQFHDDMDAGGGILVSLQGATGRSSLAEFFLSQGGGEPKKETT